MGIKKLTIGLILLSTVLAVSCINGVVGNGNVEVKKESVDDFNRLKISGNFNVFLIQDDKPGLKIEADDNLLEYIKVRQIGNRLVIDCDRNIIRASKKDLYIHFTDLGKIDLEGAVDFVAERPVEVESLALFCSGAINLDMELITERMRIEASGAVNCDLKGKVKDASIVLAGAGDFNALDMQTETMDIEMSGAGRARVFVSKRLDVEIAGAGSIKYKGDPETHKSIAGIGSLKKY